MRLAVARITLMRYRCPSNRFLTAASRNLLHDHPYRCRYRWSGRRLISSDVQVKEVSVEKTPVTAELWEMRTKLQQEHATVREDACILPHLVHSTQRSPAHSRLFVSYDFDTNTALRDLYIDARGNVSTGKLLEDLDALAGNIAFKHCHPRFGSTPPDVTTSVPQPLPPLALVTASVDRITQDRRISAGDALIAIGQVCWVGKSSLDVLMEIHTASKAPTGQQQLPLLNDPTSPTRLLSSLFTYVARDRTTGKAATIHSLDIKGDNDRDPNNMRDLELFSTRDAYAAQRKAQLQQQLKSGLSGIPKKDIDAAITRGRAALDMPALAPKDVILMKHTVHENIFITQPQNTNTAGRVFGGFLLHKAFDLAHATCYTFAGQYPVFQEVGEISFKRPVDIGDLIRLTSRVVLAVNDPPQVQVEVQCQVVKPETSSSLVSNTFDFVFGFQQQGMAGIQKSSLRVKEILVSNHEEAEVMLRAKESCEGWGLRAQSENSEAFQVLVTPP